MLASKPLVIPLSAFKLRDQILAIARSKGVRLEERVFRLERGHPVLRVRLGDRVLRGCHVGLPANAAATEVGYAPDVITVHGSGERSSKMWPRKLDGTFNIDAVTDHLLHLVEVELSRPLPELHVPRGLRVESSGLVALHLAGVRLGLIDSGSKPEDLLAQVKDAAIRKRIERGLAKGGLLDADLRALGEVNRMFVSRSMTFDRDPFELWSDRTLTMLKLGQTSSDKVERRHVLIVDDQGDKVTVADPAGGRLTRLAREELTAAWNLGARKGVRWLGWVSAK